MRERDAVRSQHSVFTTILLDNGQLLFKRTHLLRLLHHCSRVGFDCSEQSITNQLVELCSANTWKTLGVRISIDSTSEIRIETRGLPKRVPVLFATAIQQQSSCFAMDIKHSDRELWNAEKRRLRVPEVLWVDQQQSILEFSNGNVFLFRDGILYTPPLNGAILPGIMRAAVIAFAAEEGVKVRIKSVQLQSDDEIFFTSSLRGIVPATFDGNSNSDQLQDFSTNLWLRIRNTDFQKRVHKEFISQSWK